MATTASAILDAPDKPALLDPIDAEAIKANVRALSAEIRERAEEVSNLRAIPKDLLDKLKRAGVFRMTFPRAWGGAEITPMDQFEVIELLAMADPSVAWCVAVGAGCGFIAGCFPDEAGRRLFPDVDMSLTAAGQPSGRAERVPGGYRLTGRWSFGSNSNNADMFWSTAPIFENGEPVLVDGVPQMRLCVAPASSYVIHDNWHTTGLNGTGSNDFEAIDLFIPEENSLHFGKALAVGRPSPRDEKIYWWWGWFIGGISPVPLGLARAAIDEAMRIASDANRKVGYSRVGEPAAMKELPRVRSAVAKAEMRLGSARAYLYGTLNQSWKEALDQGVTFETRMAVAMARLNAFQAGREIAQAMYDLVGTKALYKPSPLDRWLRDSIAASMHQMGQERMLETFGTGLFGDEIKVGFL